MLWIIIALLVLIFAAQVAIVLFPPKQAVATADLRYNFEALERQMAEIVSGTRHAAEVSAVLGLLEQIEEHPDAVEKLRSYPQTVRAAALAYECDEIGSSLKHLINQRSAAYKNEPYNATSWDFAAASYTQQIEKLKAKLDVLIKDSRDQSVRST